MKKILTTLALVLIFMAYSNAQITTQSIAILEDIFMNIPMNTAKKDVLQYLNDRKINFDKNDNIISGVANAGQLKAEDEVKTSNILYSFEFKGNKVAHRTIRLTEEASKAQEKFNSLKEKITQLSDQVTENTAYHRVYFYKKGNDGVKKTFVMMEMKPTKSGETLAESEKIAITILLFEENI